MATREALLAGAAPVAQNPPEDRILRIPETERLTSMTRMQLWRLEQEGHFPQRFKINPAAGPKGAVGHSYAEVMAWLRERRASRNAEAA